MKRHRLLASILLWAISWPALAQNPPPTQRTPNPLRHLLVVDTSFSMSRIEGPTRQAVFDLLFSGLQGHMQPGDYFTIWCFDEQVYSNRTSLIAWDPALNRALALGATRMLRELRFEKRTRIDRLGNALRQVARTAESLTVVLISDGDERIQGTPFDRSLNAIYQQRFRELKNAKKPFVTTLIAQNGAWVAFAVNAMGEAIDFNALTDQIPQIPPPTILLAAPTDVTPPPVKPAILTISPSPGQPDSNKSQPIVAANTDQTTSIEPPASPPANAEPKATLPEDTGPMEAVPALPAPASTAKLTSPPLAAANLITQPSAENVKTATATDENKKPETVAPITESTPPDQAATTTTPSVKKSAPDVPSVAPTPKPTPTTPTSPAKKTAARAIAIASPAQHPASQRLYLVLGAGSLLAVIWVSYWLVRRSRVKTRPSFISQSLERDQK